jgi:hypothetical protein
MFHRVSGLDSPEAVNFLAGQYELTSDEAVVYDPCFTDEYWENDIARGTELPLAKAGRFGGQILRFLAEYENGMLKLREYGQSRGHDDTLIAFHHFSIEDDGPVIVKTIDEKLHQVGMPASDAGGQHATMALQSDNGFMIARYFNDGTSAAYWRYARWWAMVPSRQKYLGLHMAFFPLAVDYSQSYWAGIDQESTVPAVKVTGFNQRAGRFELPLNHTVVEKTTDTEVRRRSVDIKLYEILVRAQANGIGIGDFRY